MEALPIDVVLPDVLAALDERGAVVLGAPTGAGKTTRVAPAMLEHVEGQILLVQPRRVAARAAARHIARERGWALGGRVGHHVRFDRVAGPDTRLLVVTDGILLRRLQDDPFLEGVGAVVLDEIHERGLQLDLALALVRQVRRDVRPDLRVAVMSATLDAEPIARWLDAPIVASEGRAYPVEVRYLPHADDRPVEDVVAALVRRALAETTGDVLAFLPGVAEIRWTTERLTGVDAAVVPLYGDLSPEAQDLALRPGARRRVVLATNVAETSLTVPGITAVVDSGLARQLRYDPGSGLDRLETLSISAASAQQRAGRAGRVAPGTCYRAWTERTQLGLAPFTTPEIRRVDLASPALQLLAWGEADPGAFGWFEAPRADAVDAAMTLLRGLGAFDGRLTAMGRDLSRLPFHPRVGRMLIEAHRGGRLRDGALAAVLLEERDPLRGWSAPTSSGSDVLDRVEELERRGGPLVQLADRIVRQARDVLGREGPPGDRDEVLGRAIFAGWPDRLARRRAPGSDRARMLGGRGLELSRGSAVRDAELFVAVDVDDAGGEARVRLASAVDPRWLRPETRTVVRWDATAERVTAFRQVAVGDLVLTEHPSGDATPEQLAEVLAAQAAGALDRVVPPEGELDQLLARIDLLRRAMPELGLPELTAADLLPEVAVGCRSFADLRRADWVGAARGRLDHRQRVALDQHAPTRIELPSGRSWALQYERGRAPVLAVKIQELFGVHQTPRVAAGRVQLVLHLLAPNQRPQQITDDLYGFWTRTWPEVRKELRARYPKHPWPEDPLTAPPPKPRPR